MLEPIRSGTNMATGNRNTQVSKKSDFISRENSRALKQYFFLILFSNLVVLCQSDSLVPSPYSCFLKLNLSVTE